MMGRLRPGFLSLLVLGIYLQGSVDFVHASSLVCLLDHVEGSDALGIIKTDPRLLAELDKLMRQSLEQGPVAQVARARAQVLLGLDDLNWTYFHALYERKMNPQSKSTVHIYEPGKSAPEGKLLAYPTETAPVEMRSAIHMVEYGALATSPANYAQAAATAAVWTKKMQAGTGSSMTRKSYVARLLGIPENQVRTGAKGTDLFVSVPDPHNPGKQVSISLVEAQLLQGILDVKRGVFKEEIFHDILGSETRESLYKIWDKPSLLDPSKTYRQLVQETPGLRRYGETFQSYIPTLDEKGSLSFNREAPGGHALFFIDAIRAAYKDELRPATPGKPLIAAISNGEDLSSSPDAAMVGYMIKEKAPIALVTTEKTSLDAKGGLLSLLKDKDGSISLSVVETAQAKEAGQEALYKNLGGIVSTNLTLFNYDVLSPKIKKLVNEVGEDQFLKIVAPDLISNWKEQKDADGVIRKYLQLEGAMGSSLMNLDRYWRKRYGEPLVHIINVDRGRRTEFFSPIKSAIDYFIQFHSNRFEFDPRTMRLRNRNPGSLPSFTLKDSATGDKFYQDVGNVLDSFEGLDILKLDSLHVEGQVTLRQASLRGRVSLLNHSGKKVDLDAYFRSHRQGTSSPMLENAVVEIGPDGKVDIRRQ